MNGPKRNAKKTAQEINRVDTELSFGYIDRTKLEGTRNVGLPMSCVESDHAEESDQKHEPWIMAQTERNTTRDRNKHFKIQKRFK